MSSKAEAVQACQQQRQQRHNNEASFANAPADFQTRASLAKRVKGFAQLPFRNAEPLAGSFLEIARYASCFPSPRGRLVLPLVSDGRSGRECLPLDAMGDHFGQQATVNFQEDWGVRARA